MVFEYFVYIRNELYIRNAVDDFDGLLYVEIPFQKQKKANEGNACFGNVPVLYGNDSRIFVNDTI